MVLTLKATPLAATITVYEIFGVGTIIRQETYSIYEPLLLIAGVYIFHTAIIDMLFHWLEGRVPKASG
jgi:polar amino acid transport system permease protein